MKPFIVEGMNLLNFQDQWGVPIVGSPPGNPSMYALNSPWGNPGGPSQSWKGMANPGIHHWRDRRVPQGTWVDQGQYLIDKVIQQNDLDSIWQSPICTLPNGSRVSPTMTSDYFVGQPMQVKAWALQMFKRAQYLRWCQRRNSFGFGEDFEEWFNTYRIQNFEPNWGTKNFNWSNFGQTQHSAGGVNSGFMANYYPFAPMTRVNFGRLVYMRASAGNYVFEEGTPADWDHLQLSTTINFVGAVFAGITHSISHAFGSEVTSETLSITLTATASGKTKNTLRQIHGFLDGTTITSKFVEPNYADSSGINPATGPSDAQMYFCTNWEERFKPGGFQRIMANAVSLGPVSPGIVTWNLDNALDKQPDQEQGGELCFFTCPSFGTMPPMVGGGGWLGLDSYGGWTISRANQKETPADCPGPHKYPVGGSQPVGQFGDAHSVLGRLNAQHLLWEYPF
jgi:hypothetical protein